MGMRDESIECPPGTTFFSNNTPEGLVSCCILPGQGLHGPWVRKREWEGLVERGEYREGKRHGLWTLTSMSGVVFERAEYRYGMRHGIWFEMPVIGNYQHHGAFLNDKRHGVWVDQSRAGVTRSEGTYEHGVRHGLWCFYEEGQLESKGNFVRGTRSGTWFYYGRNGHTEATGAYVDDTPVGVWSFHEAGFTHFREIDFGQPGDADRQRWQKLLPYVVGTHSAEIFKSVLELLETWPESELDEAIRFVTARIASWPDDERFVPGGEWTELILRGIEAHGSPEFYGASPKTPEELRRVKLWPLARSLKLWRVDTSIADIRRVVSSPLAVNITELELEEVWARGFGDVLVNPGFPKLKSLHVRECGISVSALVALAESPQGVHLQSLWLTHEGHHDEDLAPLFASAGFGELRDFHVLGCSMEDHCAHAIHAGTFLHRLESLELEPSAFSIEFLRKLGGLRFERLRSLRLGKVKLEKRDVAYTPEEVRTFIAGVMRRQKPSRWD